VYSLALLASAYEGELHPRVADTAALNAAAHLARSKACARLALNVFARNETAQLLYRKLGFSVVSLHMNKPL